jgi:hypothetical protein
MSTSTMSLILDIILILVAVGIVLSMRGLGGAIGRSLGVITAGVVVLGLAHITETLTLLLRVWTEDVGEITHRLIVLAGFVLLYIGFRQIAKLR